MNVARPTVAIVGGGITGACAASALSASCDVTVFDQGRRGPGGRASHRRVSAPDGAVLPDDGALPADDASTFEFDHGCQFTRADDPAMLGLVSGWCERGWLERWAGPFGSVGEGEGAEGDGDFFGLPGSGAPVFVGVGGMHMLPRRVLGDCSATVRGGERVADMAQGADGKWELFGTAGEAAFHDTAETDASKVSLSLSLALSLSRARARPAPLSLSLSLSLARSLSHALSLSLSLSRDLHLSLTHSLSLSHTLPLSQAAPGSLGSFDAVLLTDTHSHTHTHSHSHTHTHSHIHTHTHTHRHTHTHTHRRRPARWARSTRCCSQTPALPSPAGTARAPAQAL